MVDADDHEGERYHGVQGIWDDPGDFLFHRRTVFFHSVPLHSKGGRYNIYPPTQTISRGSASEERQTEHGLATLLSSCRRTLPMHCHVSGLHLPGMVFRCGGLHVGGLGSAFPKLGFVATSDRCSGESESDVSG